MGDVHFVWLVAAFVAEPLSHVDVVVAASEAAAIAVAATTKAIRVAAAPHRIVSNENMFRNTPYSCKRL